MNLNTYRCLKSLSYRQLAAEVQASVRAVHEWCSGKRLPSPAQAERIARLTGGAVSVVEALWPNGLPADVAGGAAWCQVQTYNDTEQTTRTEAEPYVRRPHENDEKGAA